MSSSNIKVGDYYALAGLYAGAADGHVSEEEIVPLLHTMEQARLKVILAYQTTHTFEEFLLEVKDSIEDQSENFQEMVKLGIVYAIVETSLTDLSMADKEKLIIVQAQSILDVEFDFDLYANTMIFRQLKSLCVKLAAEARKTT